jgi:uncharacterized membrane protein YgcG
MSFRHLLLHGFLPHFLPLLHVMAGTPEGSSALLSAVTAVVKRQQVANCALAALIEKGGQVMPAAAGVMAAIPGPAGKAMAQLLVEDTSRAVTEAIDQGLLLAEAASHLMARATAMTDPVLAPLAGYLAATQLPPGQVSRPWAVVAAVTWVMAYAGVKELGYSTSHLLKPGSAQVEAFKEAMEAALAQQHAAAVSKQATQLVKMAGGGAAEAEQLAQQLQRMWLGPDVDVPTGLSGAEGEGPAAGEASAAGPGTTRSSSGGGSSSGSGGSNSDGSGSGGGGGQTGCSSHGSAAKQGHWVKVPEILTDLCNRGAFNLPEVLAAGDPSQWSSALGPTTEEDLRVASTALLAACKAAGAVAQLPGLLKQLQPIMTHQPWGRAMAHGAWGQRIGQPTTMGAFVDLDAWATPLTPLLARLLPAQQAAELQKLAAAAQGDIVPGRDMTDRVLSLLGHVVAPGAPGCSYPGCCNLEGRSEAELPTQVCSQCKGARYCCREHQLAHWKAGHKEGCKAAQAAAQQVHSMAAATKVGACEMPS